MGGGAGVEPRDITLEAREDGAADVALLPAPDFRLSSALFYKELAHNCLGNSLRAYLNAVL